MADVLHFPELASTSDWLAAHAAAHPDVTWVHADAQTAGHGRQNRAWASLAGNLAASVLVRPQPGEGPPQQLSFVAALALADAVAPWTGRLRLSLKWPNDVLLHGGKLAGILLERAIDTTVIGFGVNIAVAPAGLNRKVACLADASDRPPSPAALLADLAVAFARHRAAWREQGFAPVRRAWLTRATPIGWRIAVHRGDTQLAGTFAGIAEDGALLLREGSRTHVVHAGEVFAL